MKFVNITYGLKGESKQYTYLVNDNVKVGQVIFPSFRHYPDGKKTTTVGIVQTTNSVTSKDGLTMAKMMNENGIVPNYIATSLNKTNFQKDTGISKTTINENNLWVATTPENYDNARTTNKMIETRELNKQLAMEQEGSNKDVNKNIEINARNGKSQFEQYRNQFTWENNED